MKYAPKYRLFVLLLALLLLCGCAAAPNDAGAMAPDVGNTGDGIYENGAASSTGIPQTSQKLIYTITIDAETDDLNTLLSDLEAQLAALGGYIQSKSVRAGSSSANYSTRYATMTLRIPVEQFRSFVSHVQGATNILSSSETAEDVTLQYVAVESRIKALETEEARLLELLETAATLNDLLTLESKLSSVRQELEEIKSQMKLLENQIAYSTIHLNITEVVEFTVAKETPTVWARISSGFVNSLKGVWKIFIELFVFLIVALPYLIIPAAISVLVIVRSKKKKSNPPQKPQQPQPPAE